MGAFKTHKKTAWVIGLAIGAMLGWEVYVYFTPERADTISEVYLSGALKHPIIPLLVGIALGHMNAYQTKIVTYLCSKCGSEIDVRIP